MSERKIKSSDPSLHYARHGDAAAVAAGERGIITVPWLFAGNRRIHAYLFPKGDSENRGKFIILGDGTLHDKTGPPRVNGPKFIEHFLKVDRVRLGRMVEVDHIRRPNEFILLNVEYAANYFRHVEGKRTERGFRLALFLAVFAHCPAVRNKRAPGEPGPLQANWGATAGHGHKVGGSSRI